MDAVHRAVAKVSVLVQREDVEQVQFVAVVAAAFALFLALLRICIIIAIAIVIVIVIPRSESSPSPFIIARPPRPSSTSGRMNVTFFDPHILRRAEPNKLI